jgi:ribosomal protein S12 methylthiotransferase accessory factor
LRAQSLTGKDEIYCPAQLVSWRYYSKNTKTPERATNKEPLLRWCISTGLATSQSLDGAIKKGVLEVIERDAFMITYLNNISAPVIDLEYLSFQDEELEKICEVFKRYNLEIYCVKLLTDFPVYSIAGVIIDRTGRGPAFTIGNCASFDLKQAILSSLTEAHSLRLSLKKRFTDSLIKNKSEMNAIDRIIYWSKLENLPKINFFTSGSKIKIDLDTEKNFYDIAKETEKNTNNKLNILLKNLKNKKLEACYVEVSDYRIKKMGLRSVQVVIPELQPLYLSENLPYQGVKRLKSIPSKLGYQPAEELNQEPHPFS